jgi:hypothetical protein
LWSLINQPNTQKDRGLFLYLRENDLDPGL